MLLLQENLKLSITAFPPRIKKSGYLSSYTRLKPTSRMLSCMNRGILYPLCTIFFEDDRAIPIAVQESMAGLLGDYSQFRVETSHSEFLSQSGKVAKGCELAAKIGLENSATY